MQLTAVIVLVASLHVAASGLSQSVTFSGKDVSLEKICTAIRKQTGYFVAYKSSQLKESRPIDVEAKAMDLQDFLIEVLRDQPLHFSIEGKTIFIRSKISENPAPQPVILDEEAGPITGVVVDSTGSPLSGATVINRRTKKSVQTNSKGEFSIEADANDELKISFIGFDNSTITASNSGLIVLRVSNSPLDEVQVQAYGTTSRRFSTGNVTTIKSDVIEKQPINNPLLALMGRVPGLTIIQSNGNPGAAVKIQLRGQNSYGAGKKESEPLFVIDGIPFNNNIPGLGGAGTGALNDNLSAFSFINPNDIESIDVLKDGDATAIYGSRGANGVVLITTKKGKVGNARVDIGAYSGFSEVAKKLPMMNTQQYLQMRHDALANDNMLWVLDDPNQAQNYPDLMLWDQNRYTDWQEVFLGGKANYFGSQATISGGTPGVQYMLGGGYNSEGYVYPGNPNNEKATGNFNITGYSANRKLRLSLTVNYTFNKATSSLDFAREALILPPNAPSLYKENGELNWGTNPLTGLGTWKNPYADLLQSTKSKTEVLAVATDISYKILPALTIKTTLGFNKVVGSANRHQPFGSIDPATWAFETRRSNNNFNESRSWSVEPQILYNEIISQGRLDVVAGATLQGSSASYSQYVASGFASDALMNSLQSALNIDGFNIATQYKYAGIFGRVTYNWNEKYILNLNGRRDGSSRFGPQNAFGNFGSVGAAWVVSNEKILHRLYPVLSFLKLRFSYGTTGNDGIGDYGYFQRYYTPGHLLYQGAKVMLSSGVSNPAYHWESVAKMEYGIELGFFKDRITAIASYYRNRCANQLGVLILPKTAGTGNFNVNQDAVIQNMGAEFTLSSTNIKNKNFTWSTAINLSVPRNKLIAGWPNLFVKNYVDPMVGKPFYGTYTIHEFRGVDPVAGRYQFADFEGKTNADIFSAIPRSEISILPEYFGGISNSFSYKGFSLDIFFQFTKQKGRDHLFHTVFGPGPGYLWIGSYGQNGGNQPAIFADYWREPGDISNFQKPSTIEGLETFAFNYVRNSDRGYADASFIRLKNLSFSYSISDRLKQKLKIGAIRVYIQAQNLLTFTDFTGLDPETVEAGVLPPLRVFNAGFHISLN